MASFGRVLFALMFALGLTSAAQASDQIAYGEYLSSQCVTCHQASGADKGIPSITGWETEAFVAVMHSYKTKERENKVMINVTTVLSDEEISALAAYFATLKAPE